MFKNKQVARRRYAIVKIICNTSRTIEWIFWIKDNPFFFQDTFKKLENIESDLTIFHNNDYCYFRLNEDEFIIEKYLEEVFWTEEEFEIWCSRRRDS